MSNTGESVVTGVGLVCPVGVSAPRGLAALRAGITRYVEHPHYCPQKSPGDAGEEEEPKPATVAAVIDVEADLSGPERLVHLALRALQGLFHEGSLERRDIARSALLVALPSPDPVVASWGLGPGFAAEVGRRGGVDRWAGTEVSETGAPGVFRLIERARELLSGGRVETCVVLCADTYVDVPRLGWLDGAYRLKSPRNVDGFIPSEAAVALLIETPKSAERREARPLARIGSTGFGSEPSPITSEGWSTGKGLSDALRAVAAAAGGRVPSAWTLCNLNGESYRAREWGIVTARLGELVPPPVRLSHPADTIGDAGAAMGGLLVASALHLFARGHAPASSALLWATSDDASRGALTLSAIAA